MKPIFQGESGKAAIALMPRRWWAGAARILGLSSAVHATESGRGFDFAALHRSLESVGRKRQDEA